MYCDVYFVLLDVFKDIYDMPVVFYCYINTAFKFCIALTKRGDIR
jgi:hypothetical protein